MSIKISQIETMRSASYLLPDPECSCGEEGTKTERKHLYDVGDEIQEILDSGIEYDKEAVQELIDKKKKYDEIVVEKKVEHGERPVFFPINNMDELRVFIEYFNVNVSAPKGLNGALENLPFDFHGNRILRFPYVDKRDNSTCRAFISMDPMIKEHYQFVMERLNEVFGCNFEVVEYGENNDKIAVVREGKKVFFVDLGKLAEIEKEHGVEKQ